MSKKTLENDFSDFYYEFLHSHTDKSELLLKENLEVASYIPNKVLTDIKSMDEHKTAPSIRIVISLLMTFFFKIFKLKIHLNQIV